MGFVEAVKSFYGRYFDFDGRSSRSEYWWVQLFYIIMIIVLIIPFVMGIMGAESGNVSDGAAMLSFVPLVLFVLAGIIPMIAVTVRRFHDQDKSGWMYLLSFIPYVGGIVIIVFMCLEGTRGENRFGPDPLESMYDTFS